MELTRHANTLAVLALAVGLLTGCREKPTQPAVGTPPQQRYEAAKALFEKASREFHIPSAQARGVKRTQLEDRAAAIYSELARHYGDQPIWAAQALRSLGHIHAARTNLIEAVRAYAEVAQKFPMQDFEVLIAWKSAGDLLSNAGKPGEAKVYYEKLLARFDRQDALPIVQSVVRGAKARSTANCYFRLGIASDCITNAERLDPERPVACDDAAAIPDANAVELDVPVTM